jgi:hypothetical protein
MQTSNSHPGSNSSNHLEIKSYIDEVLLNRDIMGSNDIMGGNIRVSMSQVSMILLEIFT